MNNTNHPSYYKPKNQDDLDRYGLFDLDKFIRSLERKGLNNVFGKDSHLSDHLGKTLTEQLECICDGSRRLMSSINNQSLMNQVIREALLLHSESISKWVGVTGIVHAQRLALRVHLFPDLWKDISKSTESVGVKFNADGNIEVYKTPSYFVVLTRTEISTATPYGFSVRTVYPDIRSEYAYPVEIDLQEYITKTNSYKEGSPVKKTYLEHITEYGQEIPLIRYDENKTHEFITLALPSEGDTSIICLIDHTRTTITEYESKNDGEKNNFTSAETAHCLSRHPKYKRAENKMRNSINRYTKSI